MALIILLLGNVLNVFVHYMNTLLNINLSNYLIMKKLFFCCVVLSVICSSCGSSWNIEGNNMTIVKCNTDTVAPAGSYLMLPDSLK